VCLVSPFINTESLARDTSFSREQCAERDDAMDRKFNDAIHRTRELLNVEPAYIALGAWLGSRARDPGCGAVSMAVPFLKASSWSLLSQMDYGNRPRRRRACNERTLSISLLAYFRVAAKITRCKSLRRPGSRGRDPSHPADCQGRRRCTRRSRVSAGGGGTGGLPTSGGDSLQCHPGQSTFVAPSARTRRTRMPIISRQYCSRIG
jgi:hypothetical protein